MTLQNPKDVSILWKALIWAEHHLIWVPLVILLWFVLTDENKRGTAKAMGDGRIRFTPGRLAAWGRPALGAWFIYWAAHHALTIEGFDSHLLHCVVDAILALMLLFSTPRTIVVSEKGMAQVRWYGRKKFIPWSEIAEISTGIGGGAVTVTSAHGVKVTHGPPLADRQTFLQEIRKHCSDNLPPEFPRDE